jgi:hypothetical protein
VQAAIGLGRVVGGHWPNHNVPGEIWKIEAQDFPRKGSGEIWKIKAQGLPRKGAGEIWKIKAPGLPRKGAGEIWKIEDHAGVFPGMVFNFSPPFP